MPHKDSRVFTKISTFEIGDSFKNASDIIGEPSTMFHEMTRYDPVLPGDKVMIIITVINYGNKKSE